MTDMADVTGYQEAKQALEVAAAGGHPVLMIGVDGYAVHQLANRVTTILPDTPFGGPPPMVTAHYTSTPLGMFGGANSDDGVFTGTGPTMDPGDVSLASYGVLHLQDLPLFPPRVLDGLRQPVQDGYIQLFKGGKTAEYIARPLVVATTAPCPKVHLDVDCDCSQAARAQWKRRMIMPCLKPIIAEVNEPGVADRIYTSQEIQGRVIAARELADQRNVGCNHRLTQDQFDQLNLLGAEAGEILDWHLRVGHVSARSALELSRIALTVNDLSCSAGMGLISSVCMNTAARLIGLPPAP